MRLVGYSRRKLEAVSDLRFVFEAVSSTFEVADFRFSVEVGQRTDGAEAFHIERGLEKLKRDEGVGFFKEDVVAAGIDNQAFSHRYFVYPFSTVQIETFGDNTDQLLPTHRWLLLAEKMTATLQLEVCFVLGEKETARAYRRTPLGVGIGLIQVFWIMCYGQGYSALIPTRSESTSFFLREDLAETGCKGFVSAQSYSDYCSAPPDLFERQRKEIGNDLFNRLPVERTRTGGAEASWIFSPENIFRFIRFVLRERLTNWRKYQAKRVPDYYRK